MLKYLLFIIFFTIMLFGYLTLAIPPETCYDEVLTRVWQGNAIVFICGIGSLFCLHRISR